MRDAHIPETTRQMSPYRRLGSYPYGPAWSKPSNWSRRPAGPWVLRRCIRWASRIHVESDRTPRTLTPGVLCIALRQPSATHEADKGTVPRSFLAPAPPVDLCQVYDSKSGNGRRNSRMDGPRDP